jgi:protein-tyrosine phosphatase
MSDIVLFLCTGNYYRSRFAEILFNHLAGERGATWRAASRGLDLKIGRNVGPLSPFARAACEARGLALPKPLRLPKAVCEEDLRAARVVVAVKEGEHRRYLQRLFPAWADRVRYWQVHDLDCSAADAAMAQLEEHVRSLLSELTRTPRG